MYSLSIFAISNRVAAAHTLSAALLMAGALWIAYFTWRPIAWSGVGKLSVLALLYPMNTVLLVPILVGLGVACWRGVSKPATFLYFTTAILMAVVVVLPLCLLWSTARNHGVQLSLVEYYSSSVGVPDAVGVKETVTYYITAEGRQLELDIWRPLNPATGIEAGASIAYIHGGAWIRGSRGEAPSWTAWFLSRGYAVFDIEYRLPPQAGWRDEVGDIKCALGWIASNARHYRVVPEKLAIMGASAGGNLAMLAAYSAQDPRLPPSCDAPALSISSVVNLYGPVDLERLYSAGGSPKLIQPALEAYVGQAPTPSAQRYKQLSPIHHVDMGAPPTISFFGAQDRVLPASQAEAIRSALRAAGVREETWVLPGSDHAFDANWSGFSAQFARERIKMFLERSLVRLN